MLRDVMDWHKALFNRLQSERNNGHHVKLQCFIDPSAHLHFQMSPTFPFLLLLLLELLDAAHKNTNNLHILTSTACFLLM